MTVNTRPIRLAVVNFNAHWMPKIYTRLISIAAALKKNDVDMIACQELATYNNAEHLSDLMGWGGDRIKDDNNPKSTDSCVLHGGFVPVSTGLIWNPKKIQCANAVGPRVTYDGWARNKWFTGGDFEIFGKWARVDVTHLEFEPKGPNTIKKYDEIRRKQTEGLLDKRGRKGRTHIVLADANCDLDDARDGFGGPLHAHGMHDFDERSKGRQNGNIGTAKTTWARGGRIIRGGCTDDVRLTWQNTVRMHDWTDHNALVQELVVPE